MEQVEIVPKPLFIINLVDKKTGKVDDYYKEMLVTQKSIDYYSDWSNYIVEIVKPLDAPSFEGVVLEESEVNRPFRCYKTQSYKLTSPKPLDGFSLDVLRAYGVFMKGQRTGVLNKSYEENGKYIYELSSSIDSSD